MSGDLPTGQICASSQGGWVETCSSTVEGTHEHLHASECRKWLVVLKTTRQKKNPALKPSLVPFYIQQILNLVLPSDCLVGLYNMLGNCELRVRNAEFVQQLEKRSWIIRLLSAQSLCVLSVADTRRFGGWDVSGEGEWETGIMEVHPIKSYSVKILSLRLAELFLKSWNWLYVFKAYCRCRCNTIYFFPLNYNTPQCNKRI